MCDMCSSHEIAYRIELEGSRLNVCEKCSSYGRIISRVKQEEPNEKKQKNKFAGIKQEINAKPAKETETVQLIVDNYAQLIKGAREKLGLKQKEVAKKIAEKESVIHKLESGKMKPGIHLARKLEKFLKIILVESIELEESGTKTGTSSDSSQGLTIGDLMKKK